MEEVQFIKQAKQLFTELLDPHENRRLNSEECVAFNQKYKEIQILFLGNIHQHLFAENASLSSNSSQDSTTPENSLPENLRKSTTNETIINHCTTILQLLNTKITWYESQNTRKFFIYCMIRVCLYQCNYKFDAEKMKNDLLHLLSLKDQLSNCMVAIIYFKLSYYYSEKTFPSNLLSSTSLLHILQQDQNQNEAKAELQYLNLAIECCPYMSSALSNRAKLLAYKEGKINAAIDDLHTALEYVCDVEKSEIYYRKSLILSLDFRMRESLESISKAISFNSRNYKYFLKRGECHLELKQFSNALEDTKQSLLICKQTCQLPKQQLLLIYHRILDCYNRLHQYAPLLREVKKMVEEEGIDSYVIQSFLSMYSYIIQHDINQSYISIQKAMQMTPSRRRKIVHVTRSKLYQHLEEQYLYRSDMQQVVQYNASILQNNGIPVSLLENQMLSIGDPALGDVLLL